MGDWRVVAALFVGGLALTLARRYDNDDTTAGAGVAGFTMLIIGAYVLQVVSHL